jgi:hypothetical protein
MEQENRQQYGPRFELVECRQQVDLRGNPEHEVLNKRLTVRMLMEGTRSLKESATNWLPGLFAVRHTGQGKTV